MALLNQQLTDSWKTEILKKKTNATDQLSN